MRGAKGFTLVEVLVVVVIIGVLAAMIVPQIVGRTTEARRSSAQNQIAQVSNAIQTFYLDYERWPNSLDELVSQPADISDDRWKDPLLRAKDVNDPWGNPLVYRHPGQHGVFDLYSLGADGQEGGEGDNAPITNWE
ncbi:MAG: type II secretion system major pseudopilin GspG [Phycisphaeraceae bacterium]